MKLKISHNLDDSQLEEALEKALVTLRKSSENADSPLPDHLSEEIREEAFHTFSRVTRSMMDEIKKVINKEG